MDFVFSLRNSRNIYQAEGMTRKGFLDFAVDIFESLPFAFFAPFVV